MIAFWTFLFPGSLPAPGDHFVLDTENPFDVFEVEILDVRRGWIRYRHAGGYISTMSWRLFRTLYRKVEPV